ncbi:putative C6 transcription factor [Metarhizium anisopliae]|nr:putative C6 transcription factor [Metarhizium anisopliae]
MRVAQKMGLHHDGERLGLGPFEVEIRRRVWWQAVANEFRLAALSGQPPMLPKDWDKRTPQNVNDADMFRGSDKPIRSRDGPTEMVYVLLVNYAHVCTWSAAGMRAVTVFTYTR